MKTKIKEHVDTLFADIYETKQLQELKEEISANLLERINDLIAKGGEPREAFNQAVMSLGDMSELVGSLKKASPIRADQDQFQTPPLDKKHIIGYVIATAVLLFGLMVSGIQYLQLRNPMIAVASAMPFVLVAAPVLIYLGLTQETRDDYGMSNKRALLYTAASEILLFGGFSTGIMYFQGQEPFIILSSLMPFLIVSVVMFIYLGLTEKSRRKMGSDWEQQWIEYYSNPQVAMVRGNISGALWIFAFAAFFLVAFTWGWKYSWLVFVVAVGVEVLIQAYFAAKRKVH